MDGTGVLYMADQFNQRIRKVALDGTITTIAGTGSAGFGGDGGPATAAMLNYPGGMTLDAEYGTQAAATYRDFSLITASHPAAPGETIIVYATGLGAVDPVVATGAAASGTVLSNTVTTYTATIAGQNAKVVFSGLGPNFVALGQVDLTIPTGAPSGSEALVLSSGGDATSNVVKIQIQ